MNKTGMSFVYYLTLGISLFSWTAYGQSGVGISPPRAELSAAPGSQVSQTVRVDNPSSVSNLVVNVVASDALLAPDSSILWVLPGSHTSSLAPWLNVNPLQFDLEPGGRRDVTYTVSVPADAADGTYWAVLFFESAEPPEASPEAAEGVGVISRVRVGHTIYVDVGQPTQSGSIKGINYVSRSSYGVIAVNFQNTGSGLLRLDGRLELRDVNGDLVQTLTIGNQVSFPGAVHEINFPLEELVPSGKYTSLAVLDFGASQVILGEATVSIP